MLYKILLVDDEAEVRQSIVKKIDWEAAGFEIVGDAENGQDALEKVENMEPDVVITDIKMPYMDGLELSERIRQLYPAIKIIIFSGFDDFEYAQQAIKINVTEYILKPVDVLELTNILQMTKNKLDSEIEMKKDVEHLRVNYLKNLPIIREHFLNDMLNGKVNSADIQESLADYEIPINYAARWLVASAKISKPTGQVRAGARQIDEELLPVFVQQILEERLGEDFSFASIQSMKNIISIVAMEDRQTLTSVLTVLNQVCKECGKILGLRITIGVGSTCESLADIPQSYRESKEALGYESIVGAGNTIYINDVEPVKNSELVFDEKLEQSFVSAVKFGSEEEILNVIQEITGKMHGVKVHSRQHQTYIIAILNTLTGLIQRYEVDDYRVFGDNIDYFDTLQKLNSQDELEIWLTKVCLRLNRCIQLERENTRQSIVSEAKEFIEENYQDPDLSVEMVCGNLHITAAYFSTVFKKETGKSYVAYLTELRMNKAVDLLNNTDEKTYMIAEKVGYTEPNYFSYVFKKQFGVSPTKFRGKK